jgi:hypothetical protein
MIWSTASAAYSIASCQLHAPTSFTPQAIDHSALGDQQNRLLYEKMLRARFMTLAAKTFDIVSEDLNY